MKMIPLVLAAALLPLSALQQGSSRQAITPATSHTELIPLGDGVPRGSMILGETLDAPRGYASTGLSLTVTTGIAPWTTIASMPSPRERAAAVAVNGRLYVIGGTRVEYGVYPSDPHDVAVAAVDEYDPQTGTWTTMPTPMPTPRFGHAVLAVSGRILVAGGQLPHLPVFPWSNPPLASVHEYNPVTDTWSSRSPMLAARSGHALVEVDGRIFAVGGDQGRTMEEYDPIADSWQFRASPVSSWGPSRLVSANGRLYAVGAEEYDPATDSWTLRSTSFPLGDGKAMSVNGRVFRVGSKVWEFDPVNYTTTVRADYTIYTIDHGGALASMNGFIYALGGAGEDAHLEPVSLASAERFDLGAAFQTLYVHRKN